MNYIVENTEPVRLNYVTTNIMNRKLLYGFGVNDYYDGPVNTGTKIVKFYAVWRSMIARCYDPVQRTKYSSWEGCKVCDEWKSLVKFKEWFDKNYIEGYELDKDILIKGNKLYSPETCCFVPKELNRIFETKPKKIKGNTLPEGVMWDSSRGLYISVLNRFNKKRLYIGRFISVEEASIKYQKAKNQYLSELAEEYYKNGKINKRVYLAILHS